MTPAACREFLQGEKEFRFDLYRIPFNGGKGGRAEPVKGASANGMSNSFPKVSPDGRWIVFVQAKNGQLMRPDSELYIVPAKGGKARRMRSTAKVRISCDLWSIPAGLADQGLPTRARPSATTSL